MKSFIETLINRKFDLGEEILSLKQLLKDYSNLGTNLYSYINNSFKKWRHRSTFISLDQLFEKMSLDTIIKNIHIKKVTINTFIYFSECIYNIMFIVRPEDLPQTIKQNREAIIENINNILTQINYKIHYFENEDYYKFIENDWKISESAEVINDKYDLGEKIYLYRHYSLKSQLFDKADILCRLYKVFEGKYEKILKSNQYTTLADNIGFLSDKLDVRHAPNPKEKLLLEGLTREEQEQWYDDLFEMYLDMLILCNHIEKRKDVKELSKTLALIKPID